MTKVYSIAVTGGIASGKSQVCSVILEAGYPVFFCDDEAKRIIRTDVAVREALTALVGSGLYDAEGRLVKHRLASFLCQGKTAAAQVDAIVHPRVALAFQQWLEGQTSRLAFMECALLFESGFDVLVDESMLVFTPEPLRTQRLMRRDGISAGQAAKWMALQMSEDEKIQRASTVILNDGTPQQLRERVAEYLSEKLGQAG